MRSVISCLFCRSASRSDLVDAILEPLPGVAMAFSAVLGVGGSVTHVTDFAGMVAVDFKETGAPSFGLSAGFGTDGVLNSATGLGVTAASCKSDLGPRGK